RGRRRRVSRAVFPSPFGGRVRERGRRRDVTVRVIVLGGPRVIGRAVVEELAATGHELLLVHRGPLEPEGLPPAEHLHLDRAQLRDHARELAAFQPDGLIDCRALTRVDAETVLASIPSDLRLVVISSLDVYRAFGAVNASRETDPVPLDAAWPVPHE